MALWVNGRLAGRGFLRLAYFTPTVLPMIAVANIWLFFYTPQYGLLEQVTQLARPAAPQLARQQAHRARLPDRRRGLEGGGLLHDLLPGRAAADLAAARARRRRSRARRAASTSAACTFPLLMPTTLFVLVNASSTPSAWSTNHRHDPRRSRQREQLLLYYIYEVGFSFWDIGLRGGADRGAAGAARRRSPSRSSSSSIAGCITDDAPMTPATTVMRRRRRVARSKRRPRGCSALLWILPLAYAFWTAFHPAAFSTRFVLAAPLTLREFRQRLAGGAVRALLPQHDPARAR